MIDVSRISPGRLHESSRKNKERKGYKSGSDADFLNFPQEWTIEDSIDDRLIKDTNGNVL